MTPYLVLVAGPSCTGKTTLARALADRLKLLLIAKDMLKETLFDTLGVGDQAWSQRLGRASIALMYRLAEAHLAAGHSLILENNFYPDLATQELRAIQARTPFIPIQVQLWTQPEVLIARIHARVASGTRHPGHLEHLYAPTHTPETILWRTAPMDIGGALFEVDTTDLGAVDVDALAAQIRAMMERGGAAGGASPSGPPAA